MNLFDVVRVMQENEKESARKADLLFGAGKETCTDEEAEIIFSYLDFNAQMAKLQVLRGEKPPSPRASANASRPRTRFMRRLWTQNWINELLEPPHFRRRRNICHASQNSC